MNYAIRLPIFLTVGILGGFIGSKLKIPAGVLIGSLLAVICFKLISRVVFIIITMPIIYKYFL